MRRNKLRLLTFLLCFTLCGLSAPALTIKMGSIAPFGSPWDKALKKLAVEWQKVSRGKVTLKIYSGGIAGGELDMIRKMRINQLQAAAMTGVGLGKIAWDLLIIQLPFVVRTDDELDYVFEKMSPTFNALLQEKGFKLLAFTKAGWAHFFSKRPVIYPEDLRQHKMQVLKGSEDIDRAWREMGFHIIPLDASDAIPALQSGMVETFSATPLTAAAMQWFALAKNMTDFNWAPLIGGIVVTTRTWNRIPKDLQPKLMAATESIFEDLNRETIKVEAQAMKVMLENGLIINHVPPEAELEWKKMVDRGFGILIGSTLSRDLYEETLKYLEEFRSR